MRDGAKNLQHGLENAQHGAENMLHSAKNVQHGAANARHGAKNVRHGAHIVPYEKFHRIEGAPPETFPNVKYDFPEEVGGHQKGFDSPIRK